MFVADIYNVFPKISEKKNSATQSSHISELLEDDVMREERGDLLFVAH